jgi:uncharacterized protein (DUF2062 family)
MECGQRLNDTQSGFRIYPVEFLTTTHFLTRRYTFEIEALVRAAWAGYPIVECSVSVHYPSAHERISHFRAFRDNFRLTILHTWLVFRSLLPWPKKRFQRSMNGPGITELLFHPILFLRRIALEHSSAGELAAAVWMGVFIGSLPIIPFGLATIVYVNHRLHLNTLAGAGASNLCVAPFVPFLCIQVGYFLRYGYFLTEFNRQTLFSQIHLRIWEWLLGALIIGPLLGGLAATFTYWLVKYLRRESEMHS